MGGLVDGFREEHKVSCARFVDVGRGACCCVEGGFFQSKDVYGPGHPWPSLASHVQTYGSLEVFAVAAVFSADFRKARSSAQHAAGGLRAV